MYSIGSGDTERATHCKLWIHKIAVTRKGTFKLCPTINTATGQQNYISPVHTWMLICVYTGTHTHSAYPHKE